MCFKCLPMWRLRKSSSPDLSYGKKGLEEEACKSMQGSLERNGTIDHLEALNEEKLHSVH